MPKKIYDEDFYSSSTEDEPPKKKSSGAVTNSADFKQGELVTDISGKTWKLGKTIGIGGFGEIYEASESLARGYKTDYSYVAKVEKHTSGPLFVEINCYLRIGRPHMIEDWKNEHKLKFIGMPHYVASGSCHHNNEKYRFLLMPKYKRDLGQILKEKKVFNIKTVSNICIYIIDVLEYIHSKGYVHSDIKASNIMLGNQTKSKVSNQRVQRTKTSKVRPRNPVQSNVRALTRLARNLRPLSAVNYIDDIPYLEEVLNIFERAHTPADLQSDDSAYSSDEMSETENNDLNQVYLVDFGLASKFLQSNGEHKEFSPDERRAHAGTVLFCSRDAHKGVPSRRSDLESLAYNMVYWLTGSLPWIEDLEQPGEVEKKKIRCFRNIKCFLDLCFRNDFPPFLLEYFEYLDKLQYTGSPDYDHCRSIFKKAIKLYGYKQDSVLDFDNLEGWGTRKTKTASNKKIVTHFSFLKTSPLQPLNSNIVFKRPKLRKQGKNVKIQDSMMNWSKLLTDPETIIRQARDRTTTEGSDPGTGLTSLDIESMNPTQEMLNIFNKCMERETSPRHKTESVACDNIEGYTPAMMSVYAKIQERKELEAVMVNNNNDRQVSNKRVNRKRVKRCETPVEKDFESKSQPKARKKDSSSQATKRKRAVVLRRHYRLRG